nr:cytochrome P450 [Tanacetum cinerariifolium]
EEVVGKLELHGPWCESEVHETEGFMREVGMETLLRKANTQFSNDEDVRELYEKYGGVFQGTVLFEEEQVHVDDFHPGDNEKA